MSYDSWKTTEPPSDEPCGDCHSWAHPCECDRAEKVWQERCDALAALEALINAVVAAGGQLAGDDAALTAAKRLLTRVEAES